MGNNSLLGDALLKNNLITKRQLNNAYDIHTDTHLRLSEILIRNNMVKAIAIYKILADLSNNLINNNFSINIDDIKREIDYNFIDEFKPTLLNKKLFLPISYKKEIIKILVYDFKDKSIDKYLKNKFGDILIEKVELSQPEIKYLIEFTFKDNILNKTEDDFHRNGEETALNVFTRNQLLIFGVLGILFLTGIFFYLKNTTNILFYLINFLFLFLIITRFIIRFFSDKKIKNEITTNDKNLQLDNLPKYTILIPVKKYSSNLDNLILSLEKMDYPDHKMEIIFLGSKNFTDQLNKLSNLPTNYSVYKVPAENDGNMIKIYNLGLKLASGKYITIYNENTIPETDQLKKAVYKFEQSNKNYFCLQSPIESIMNRKGLFSKYLSIENTLRYKLFSYLDKGVYHYRTSLIKKYKGWDLYNAAENLDLIRKAVAKGYITGLLNSKTYHLSSDNFKSWFNDFTNSLKGYMQTLLVYNRNPISKIKEDGLRDILLNNFAIGGELFIPLLYVLLLISLSITILNNLWTNGFLTNPKFFFSIINLSLFLILNIFEVLKTKLNIKFKDKLKILPLIPVHWVNKSFAFIKAAVLLIHKPHYRFQTTNDKQEDKVMFMQINFLEKLNDTN